MGKHFFIIMFILYQFFYFFRFKPYVFVPQLRIHNYGPSLKLDIGAFKLSPRPSWYGIGCRKGEYFWIFECIIWVSGNVFEMRARTFRFFCVLELLNLPFWIAALFLPMISLRYFLCIIVYLQYYLLALLFFFRPQQFCFFCTLVITSLVKTVITFSAWN